MSGQLVPWGAERAPFFPAVTSDRSDSQPLPPAVLEARLHEYHEHARGAFSEATMRAVKSDTALFAEWCANRGVSALPASPITVAGFVDDMGQTRAVATVRRYLASIAHQHRAAGLPSPTAADAPRFAMRRLARTKGTRQRQAPALNRPLVDRMIAAAGESRLGLRDRAMLSVAYDSLLRRSELVAIDVGDLAWSDDGSGTVTVRRSKTDQEGAGAVAYLAADTCEHLRRWLAKSGIAHGAVFVSIRSGRRLDGHDVSRAWKRMAKAAGLDVIPSGHSTRVGTCQDMTAAGFGTSEVMQAGRWRSAAMVARYGEHQQARRGAAAKLAVLQNR